MEHARIFLVEDEEKHIKSIMEHLEHDGHFFPLEARSSREAFEHIELGELEKQDIQIVILDGYMPQNDEKGPDELWGPQIFNLIKLKYPQIKVIAYTSIPTEFATFGDVYVQKSDYSIGSLRRTINNMH